MGFNVIAVDPENSICGSSKRIKKRKMAAARDNIETVSDVFFYGVLKLRSNSVQNDRVFCPN